jgi:hypothetical protein
LDDFQNTAEEIWDRLVEDRYAAEADDVAGHGILREAEPISEPESDRFLATGMKCVLNLLLPIECQAVF